MRRGYKVALTGEGADEWLAGYPWYKMHQLLGWLDVIPGVPLSVMSAWPTCDTWALPRSAYTTLPGRGLNSHRRAESLARHLRPDELLERWLFYGPRMLEAVGDHVPYEDLSFNRIGMRRWHPLNRALYLGSRVHLPGLLLNAKGDRVAMNSSVETRYPFLDEDVFAFLARLHPHWKMRGFREKYILRLLAERWLPKDDRLAAQGDVPRPVRQLPSEHVAALRGSASSARNRCGRPAISIRRRSRHWRQAFRELRPRSYQRTLVEMGLVGVVATQLWHHTFIEASLADLPSQAPNRPRSRAG